MKLRSDVERKQRLAQAAVRTQLDCFIEPAFKTVHGAPLEPDWYLSPLCFSLQNALETKSSRLLINIPPRHLKSFTAAICLPAFAIGKNPRLKIAVAVYGEELARQHMRPLTQIMDDRWYRATFPEVQIASRKGNVLTTSLGGNIRYVSVGGAFTGLGINLLIIDDVLKAQDAASSAVRSTAERYVRETAFTRFDDQRRSRVIAISQRLHPYDISWALAEQGFEHINLPSVAHEDVKLPTYGGKVVTWRTGELLSSRFPHDVLDRLKRQMGTSAFLAQYMQTPMFSDSMIVDFARLKFEEPFARKDLEYIVMSVDPAVKVSENCDYSAITIFGLVKGKWCLVHAVEKRLEFTDLKALTASLAKEWAADQILIEDCHTGMALWDELRAKQIGSIVWPPDGDKAERLSVAVDRFYSGEVVFPRISQLVEPLFAQFRNFPEGHDDLLDSVTQFVAWMRTYDVESLLDIKHYGRPRRKSGRRSEARPRILERGSSRSGETS